MARIEGGQQVSEIREVTREEVDYDDWCSLQRLSNGIRHILYARGLCFDEAPDYMYLRQLFRLLFHKLILIELVRQRPALWNVQDPLFTDNPFKANVWKEVSSELGEDLEGRGWLRDLWHRLKNRYIDDRNRVMAAGGQITGLTPAVTPFYEQLRFLDEAIIGIQDEEDTLNDSITQSLLDETLSQHSNKSITDPKDSPPNKSPTKRSISNERKIQRKNLDTYSSTKSLNEEPLSLFDSQPSTSSNEVNRHRSAEIIRVKPQTMRDSGLFGDSLTSIINGQDSQNSRKRKTMTPHQPYDLITISRTSLDNLVELLCQRNQDQEDECDLFARQVSMDLKKLSPERRFAVRARITSLLAEENIQQISNHRLDNVKSEF